MISIFIKISISFFGSIIVFVIWNLQCSQTLLQESRSNTPAIAYIIQYAGNHNSILLNGKNGWKEFSYGDWDVYGNSKITFWTGFKSMGLPTQGALGYRLIKWDGKTGDKLPELLGAKNVAPIEVTLKKAKGLYESLENYIETSNEVGIYNPQNNLFFVKFPKTYAAWHTCNNMLISWLKSMDVEVKGCGWAGNFQISNGSL